MTVTEQNRRDEAEALPRERGLPGPPTSERRRCRGRWKIKRFVLIMLGVVGVILFAVFVVGFVLFSARPARGAGPARRK